MCPFKFASTELRLKEDQPMQASDPLPPARRGDGILVVLQNNADRTLAIRRMNADMEALLGLAPGQAVGLAFDGILGARTRQWLQEEMEYSDDAPDLGDILSRQRDIYLRRSDGQEIKVQCTLSRLLAEGLNASFQLKIPNEREAFSQQKIRDFIALNFDGRKEIDPASGLPNHHTAETFLPFLKNYLTESNLEASFAVIRIDRHAKSLARYGRDACVELLKHAANCCHAEFRTSDMVFALSDHTLGLLLFDIGRDSARVVLNRLRWNIRNHHIVFGGKSTFSVTVTICFDMLNAQSDDSLLARCEAAIAQVDIDDRNGLIELGN